MSSLKLEHISSRLKIGNARAELVRQYLNNRYHENLLDFSGSDRDKMNGEDFGTDQYTFQCKVRDKYDDIIYETDRFYPKNGSFDHVPGRDARTLANYYIVKPKNENRFFIPKTEDVKKTAASLRKYWNLETKLAKTSNDVSCDLIVFADQQIREYWKRARDQWNKSIILYEKSGSQITFKIEEGDKRVYGKILFYIPFRFLDGFSVWLKENETYDDPNTWSSYGGDSLQDLIQEATCQM